MGMHSAIYKKADIHCRCFLMDFHSYETYRQAYTQKNANVGQIFPKLGYLPLRALETVTSGRFCAT